MNIQREDVMSVLPQDLVEKARNMSKAYEYLYCIENLLRLYISSRSDYTEMSISASVQKTIQTRKDEESKNEWMSLRGNNDLFYLDFKDLQSFINNNYEYFKTVFPSLHWILGKLEDLTKCRNHIAHNSYLDEHELDVIRTNFNSILRQLKYPASLSVQSPQEPENAFIIGLNNSIVVDHNGEGDFPLGFPKDLNVAPFKLEVFYNQVGLDYKVIFENARVRIHPVLRLGYIPVEEGPSWYYESVRFQYGQYDIDGDGIDELFLAVCDEDCHDGNMNGIQVNIFKYYPPALRAHAKREENWELIGDFTAENILGNPKMYVEGNSLKVPRNLRGFYYEWAWVNGKFVETHNL